MPGAPETAPAAGTIYDIGYRRYEGARLGRGYAFRTLFVHSLRGAFGIGRGGRAKLVPFVLGAAILFPALVQAAVSGVSQGEGRLVDYHDYFNYVQMLLALFCAAQAPELVSTDQHQRVLPLYFSRALRREDYAAAKLLGMIAALLILTLTPMAVIFVARLSLGTDVAAAWRAEDQAILPILGACLAAATVMGSLSLALAALTPRRAFASAAILGLFLLTGAVASILFETLEGPLQRHALLINPLLTVHGTILWMFGELPAAPPRPGGVMPLEGWKFLANAVAMAALGAAVLFTRFARVRV
ncbi:MAG TPA: ABC transporter permease subunit [Longimicrobiaceae bacterium]|nr:ABC transporter permease subunit [Longimicrobiaceae bacterium]